MSATILCIAAALSAAPTANVWQTHYVPSEPFLWEVSAQDEFPPLQESPPLTVPDDAADPNALPPTVVPNGSFVNPFTPGAQVYDPYVGQPGFVGPTLIPDMGIYSYGLNGPQPYRLNQVISRYDFGLLPKERTDGALGQFGVFEFDAEWEHSSLLPYGQIFSITKQFGLRTWDGPESIPGTATALPGNVFRFGLDLELATPANGPYSVQVGFNPSINTDFGHDLSSDAWNFDGRGILFYRPNPWLMYAFGAGFWDRVNDKVIPYAGVVWTPDSRWEFRLLFPQPRVSYFLGHGLFGCATWAYVRGEYHVEAYEIDLETTGVRERVELEDWRVLAGIRKQSYGYSLFLEAGWVFGRDVEYLHSTPGFDVDTGFIARTGIRF